MQNAILSIKITRVRFLKDACCLLKVSISLRIVSHTPLSKINGKNLYVKQLTLSKMYININYKYSLFEIHCNVMYVSLLYSDFTLCTKASGES